MRERERPTSNLGLAPELPEFVLVHLPLPLLLHAVRPHLGTVAAVEAHLAIGLIKIVKVNGLEGEAMGKRGVNRNRVRVRVRAWL